MQERGAGTTGRAARRARATAVAAPRRNRRLWPLCSVLLPLLLAFGCGGEGASEGAGQPAAGDAPAARGGTARDAVDLSPFFGNLTGTFVLLDARTGRTVVHDPRRASTRFLPASTFKIPNTLIALETGIASGRDFALERDTALAPREPWWPAVWSEDHTLETALPASVVWYYQELARRIGERRMRRWLAQLDYGNADVSGGIDRFWLTGGLRISAEEQVEFLRRLLDGELGVSERSTALVRELLLLEEGPGYRLSGKTGWAGLGEEGEPQVGWLVGFLERGSEVHPFATNIELREAADAAERLPITKAILDALGLLD